MNATFAAGVAICYDQQRMANAKHQFGLMQVFLALTALGFALAAVRADDLTCYVLGAFAALLAGATVLERNKYAGFVAFSVLLGIYVIRLVANE